MTSEHIPLLVLSMMGSFISLLLMVNAFFTRQTLKEINEVKLKVVELIARHDATSDRSVKNEREIDSMRIKIHDLINNTIAKVEVMYLDFENRNKQ